MRKIWRAGIDVGVLLLLCSPAARATLVDFSLVGTLDHVEQPDPPDFPTLTPASVGSAASGVFTFDSDATESFRVYGAPSIQVAGATFNDAHFGGSLLNSTSFAIENDVTGDFIGVADRLFVRFDGTPNIGGGGFGTFGFSIEFIDLDATVFAGPQDPFATVITETLLNLDLSDYEIARWNLDLSDFGNRGNIEILASGNIVPIPEPTAPALGLLALCLLALRSRPGLRRDR